MSNLIEELKNTKTIWVKQRHEMAELFGYESRNKYEILNEDKQSIGFAAEQSKGFLGALVRQFLGHWRRFDVHFYDSDRKAIIHAHHPFRWLFQRFEVNDDSGQAIGALQQRFAILNKKFDVVSPRGQHLMTMVSPIWRIWTFRFLRRETEVARVEKKWAGLLSEAFTDKDNFKISIGNPQLENEERLLLLAAAVFIDLIYFEKKADN